MEPNTRKTELVELFSPPPWRAGNFFKYSNLIGCWISSAYFWDGGEKNAQKLFQVFLVCCLFLEDDLYEHLDVDSFYLDLLLNKKWLESINLSAAVISVYEN